MSDAESEEIGGGDAGVRYDGEPNEDEWQVRGAELKEAEKRHLDGRVPACPDVRECEAEGCAEVGIATCRADEDERTRDEEHEPCKVHGPACVRMFQHTTVPRHEEQVKQEIDREWAKEEECRNEAPVLAFRHRRVP